MGTWDFTWVACSLKAAFIFKMTMCIFLNSFKQLNRRYRNVLFPFGLSAMYNVYMHRQAGSLVENAQIPRNSYSLGTVLQACHSCPHIFGCSQSFDKV